MLRECLSRTVGSTSNPQNPWIVWDVRPADGANVFDQFGPGNTPNGATAVCVVVATDAHAVDEIELARLTQDCIDLP